MNQIKELLRETIGLHAPTVGSALVDHAIQARMQSCGLAQPSDYFRLLQQSPGEHNELLESVVVKETWFFRDREPFRTLVNLAQKEWLPTNPNGVLRILSAPCSTGEEPYSIAMALLDAGFSDGHFQIDASDLSPVAIATAQRAEYGRNSFRSKDLDFRTRHFQASGKNHLLTVTARKPVKFCIANLLETPGPPQTQKYDFIFCRNLLIYFDAATQQRLLHKLQSWLAPAGALFVGSAEVPIAIRNGFVSAHLPFSFACRHSATVTTTSKKAGQPSEASKKWMPPAPFQPQPMPVKEASSINQEFLQPSAGITSEPADLIQARSLLEQGRVVEAEQICEACLSRQGVSAEAYYLLGLMRGAAGIHHQAAEFYRKALYLEPNHYDTLVQWALLSQKIGDGDHARLLTERAERLKNNFTGNH